MTLKKLSRIIKYINPKINKIDLKGLILVDLDNLKLRDY